MFLPHVSNPEKRAAFCHLPLLSIWSSLDSSSAPALTHGPHRGSTQREKEEPKDLHHHRLIPKLPKTSFLGSEPNLWPWAAAEESQWGRFPSCYWERPREERMALRAHRVIFRTAYPATVAEDGAEALACLACVKIKQGQLEDALHEGLGCCSPPSPTASALVSTPSGTGSPAKQSIHI